MRLIFLGSPTSVLAPLAAIQAQAAAHGHELVGVVSQPARPVGRGGQLQDPPVAALAKSLGLPTLQPEKASSPEFLAAFAALVPDVAITAAYGQILTPAFLQVPRRATINIHPSLLPRWRGATPVPASLLAGETVTGVSILFTVQKLDAGALIVQEETAVAPDETSATLTDRLFARSGELVFAALAKLADPAYGGTPQAEALVTHCKKIHKEDGQIRWHEPAEQIVNRFRAYQPWPGTYTWFGPKRVSLLAVSADHAVASSVGSPVARAQINVVSGAGTRDGGTGATAAAADLAPGQVRFVKAAQCLLVGTGAGEVRVHRLQVAGGKVVDAAAFWNGLKERDNVVFSEAAP